MSKIKFKPMNVKLGEYNYFTTSDLIVSVHFKIEYNA